MITSTLFRYEVETHSLCFNYFGLRAIFAQSREQTKPFPSDQKKRRNRPELTSAMSTSLGRLRHAEASSLSKTHGMLIGGPSAGEAPGKVENANVPKET